MEGHKRAFDKRRQKKREDGWSMVNKDWSDLAAEITQMTEEDENQWYSCRS
jgi:hypothetical protein